MSQSPTPEEVWQYVVDAGQLIVENLEETFGSSLTKAVLTAHSDESIVQNPLDDLRAHVSGGKLDD